MAEKGQITVYQYFLPCLQCFQKTLFLSVFQTRDCKAYSIFVQVIGFKYFTSYGRLPAVCCLPILKTIWKNGTMNLSEREIYPSFFKVFDCSVFYDFSFYLGKFKLLIIMLTYNNFIIFQLFDPFPNKPCFTCVDSTGLLKTLWEKGKKCS